jgi:predicted phosphoribosyltransferase
MHADLLGSLELLDSTWKHWEHRGKKLTKDQVRKVLCYGLGQGYKYSDQLSDEEVDKLLGIETKNQSNTNAEKNL